MEDDLKKFELLPDHEKFKILKFYKIFSSVVPETQDVETVPLKSAGKQKTLDGWLLKSKGTTVRNSNSDEKNSEKNQTVSENIAETNIQDVEKCSDSEVLDFRQGDTFKPIDPPAVISDADTINFGDQPISAESVQIAIEKDFLSAEKLSNLKHSEIKRDNILKRDCIKKNPFVLVKRLDFTAIAEVNSDSSIVCSTDSIKNSNDELSSQTSSSKPNIEVNKTPMPTSSNDENFDTVERSPEEVDIPRHSSCKEKQREAYYKLKKLCLNHELDLDDIFQTPEFKEMIEKYKSLSESIVFIGSHKCATTGKVQPTVNFHKSKKRLLEALSTLKTRNN